MGLLNATGRAFGKVFNFKVDQWLDFQYLRSSTQFYITEGRRLFKTSSVAQLETFEQAATRLGWTEDSIRDQILRFSILVYLFLTISFLLTVYALWSGFTGSWMSTIMLSALIIFSLTQALSYHFWKYNLERRRLGCTLKEWFYSVIAGLKKSNHLALTPPSSDKTIGSLPRELP